MSQFFTAFVASLFLISCASHSGNQVAESNQAPKQITFTQKAKPVKTLTLEEMQKIAAPIEKTVREDHIKQSKTYHAMSLGMILDSVYGKQWRKAKNMEFTCIDGYKPVFPVSVFNKYDPYVAISEKGTDKFEIMKPMENNKIAQLGPFFIIWDYTKYPKAEKNPGLAAWVYQLVSIDLQ